MLKLHHSGLVSTVALAALAFPAQGLAQAAGDPSVATSEIIVTAQRRVEKVTSVPISITVADGARLRMISASSAGSDGHLPRQIREPPCRIEIAVSFSETSKPIYCSMVALHPMLGPGANREPVFHLIGEQLPRNHSGMAG